MCTAASQPSGVLTPSCTVASAAVPHRTAMYCGEAAGKRTQPSVSLPNRAGRRRTRPFARDYSDVPIRSRARRISSGGGVRSRLPLDTSCSRNRARMSSMYRSATNPGRMLVIAVSMMVSKSLSEARSAFLGGGGSIRLPGYQHPAVASHSW